MASLNKVTLIGNLGKDPELRYTASQQPFAKFSVATSEKFTTNTGEQREKTMWHNVVVWGKQAEIAQRYLHKGKQIYLEGSIEYREFDDPNGQKKFFTDIKCFRFLMLGSAGDRGGAGAGGGYQQGQGGGGGGFPPQGGGNQAPGGFGAPPAQEPANFGAPMQGNQGTVPESDDFNDDDIPF